MLSAIDKKILFIKTRVFLRQMEWTTDSLEIINSARSLLRMDPKDLCKDIYDILLDCPGHSKFADTTGTQLCFNQLIKFSMTYTYKDYIKVVRRILLNKTDFKSEAYTYLMSVSALLNEFYLNSTLAYMDDKDNPIGLSLLEDLKLSVWDIQLLMLTRVSVRSAKSHKSLLSDNARQNTIALYKQKYKNKFDLVMEIAMGIDDVKQAVINFTSCMPVLFATRMFARRCIPFGQLGWEREDTVNITSPAVTLIRVLLNHCDDDLIMHRKFYVREKGITIQFEKEVDKVSAITFYEMHHLDDDLHYLVYEYNLQGTECRLVLSIDDMKANTMFLMYELDHTSLLILFYHLGLFDKLYEAAHKIKNAEAQTLVVELLDRFNNLLTDNTYTYLEPLHWNYNYPSVYKPSINTGNDSAVVIKKVQVGRYVRALPSGQSASAEARRLADMYKIILEPGYTLVDEFERNQTIKASKITSLF